ncbi:Hypothetical protein POVR1_LOCUS442 [uncultured virus]|nr:Hypothetical protein POVR1_LOCUS442 [uncultured virus]
MDETEYFESEESELESEGSDQPVAPRSIRPGIQTDKLKALLSLGRQDARDDDDEGSGSGISSGESSEDVPSRKVGRPRKPVAIPTTQKTEPVGVPSRKPLVAEPIQRRRLAPPEPVIITRRPYRRQVEIEPGETDDQKDLRDSMYKVLLDAKYDEKKADLISQKFINKKYKGSTFSPEDEKELVKAEELFFAK